MDVTNLDILGKPTREIEFYPMHIISRKMSFYVYNLGFQLGLAYLGLGLTMPLK